MKCPQCQVGNREGAKFCDACGFQLPEPEKTRLIDYSSPHSYTPKFLAEKILTTRSSIEGERKLVTVLFADLAGSTAMFEDLDPEEVHEIMDGCFKIMLNEIHGREGTINQFRGDGVMALFGAPVAHEDHARRACDAALAIQKALGPYSEALESKYGFAFNMRIGLNSGPVVVGSIGDDLRMDYTADGDTTNLAARMESLARPGTILISRHTQQRVSPYFELTPLGKVPVKGKKEPVEAFRLENKIYEETLAFAREIQSELVGREFEFKKLKLHVANVIEGRGFVVSLIGEPGIGKSRLVAELKDDDLMTEVTGVFPVRPKSAPSVAWR